MSTQHVSKSTASTELTEQIIGRQYFTTYLERRSCIVSIVDILVRDTLFQSKDIHDSEGTHYKRIL